MVQMIGDRHWIERTRSRGKGGSSTNETHRQEHIVTLADLTARIVPTSGKLLREMGADMVLVHGDTSTSFCVALSAFYEGIPVGHVEAGLRSGSLREPFPEEANRRVAVRRITPLIQQGQTQSAPPAQ